MVNAISNSPQPIRAATAALIGTVTEFYDYYTYATAASLVLGEIFFPSKDHDLSTMASFASFFVGFVARPLSGAFFGNLGDKLGRKKQLIWTISLMGVATTSIGLLPSYSTMGIWAPILLVFLRVVQGVAVGGEWAGAVLLASEHAPFEQRTFFASLPQLGSPIGLLLSLLSFRLTANLDHVRFLSWGWRLPFLASSILLLVGAIIRATVRESPEHDFIRLNNMLARQPVMEVLRTAWYPILLAAAATTIGSAGFFFTNTFMISYSTTYLGISRSSILRCLSIVAIVQIVSQPISTLIAQKVGEARFLTWAATLSMFAPYPMFMLVKTLDTSAIVVGIALAVVILSAIYAVIAGFMIRAFDARIRCSGISIAYQLCAMLAGGTTPLIGTVLAHRYQGNWYPLAIFYSLLSLVSLVGIVLLGHYCRLLDKTDENKIWAPHS